MILTLWMVSTRPSAAILPGASASGAWWGTPESRKLALKADAARRTGDFSGAESSFRQGYDDALRRNDERATIGYLNGIAGCQLAQSRYTAALETWLEAKQRAKSINDRADLGAIAFNLSSLYHQVWDFDSALREAEEGRAAVGSAGQPYYLPSLLLQLGRLHEHLDDGKVIPLYREGIARAQSSGDKALEALGSDLLGAYLLGEERLGHKGHLEEAEKAIDAALHLREKYSPNELGYSWARMGALRLAQGNLEEAARWTDLALTSPGLKISEYLLRHQRGEIRMASGDRDGALADFREAIVLASRWRLDVLPASSFLTAANEQLEQSVFSSFIEAAAQEALNAGNEKWRDEAFEAVELNRAASLRDSLAFSDAWHRKLPPKYWETLGKLRIVDSKMLGRGQPTAQSNSLRLELSEMEAKAGLGFRAKNSEIFRSQSSLIHFRQGLGSAEVLLSFHLGEKESYLWAVTRDTLQLYKIAAGDEIRTQVLAFSDAVRAGRPEAVELGERLYKELFGQLEREATAKSSWLLSLDGALFEAPFAALVIERKGGKVSYLVSKHSVQTIPGAMLLSTRPEAGTGWFLGVGDPIYNAADPRWRGQKNPAGFLNFFQTVAAGGTGADNQFGRLVGSSQELNSSATNWGGQNTLLLEGTTARRDIFLQSLDKAPAIIHLATHVFAGSPALIAFGLGPKGESEYLTSTDVASLRVPGAIVVMTGCDTGSGEVRPGVGLQGLTRAWQMAGASAVLATSWPVRDSGGDLIASFYKHLRPVSAAEALRITQMEMIRSGTWRANPSYWAPYQITGRSR